MTSQIETQQSIQFEYQRQDIGVIDVVNDGRVVAFEEGSFPWLPNTSEVQTAKVTLDTGDKFRYGSLVGEHERMIKFASQVSDVESHKAEIGLFKAIPQILDKESAELPKNIDIVPSFIGIEGVTMYKVAKQGKNAARLYFTLLRDKSGVTVVKLGIASHDKQVAMQNIMSGRKSRQKHDG